jgi:hypothetical protein
VWQILISLEIKEGLSMRKTLFDLLWINFIKVQGIIGGGIVLAFLLWILSPEMAV